MGRQRIDFLINRRNAQMQRVMTRFNAQIEKEVARLKKKGVI